MKNIIYLLILGISLQGCKQNQDVLDSQIIEQFKKTTLVAKDFAERSYNQIYMAYANDNKKVEPYFIKAQLVYMYSSSFQSFVDSTLALQDFSTSRMDSVLTLYTEVMDTLRHMVSEKHQVKHQIIQDLEIDFKALSKRHPCEIITILACNAALNTSRVQDHIYRSVYFPHEIWWVDHVSVSTLKSSDSATIVRLGSAPIQSWQNRRTQVNSLFRNGKPCSSTIITDNSDEFARVSLFPAEPGNYRIIGRTILYMEDGSAFDVPFEQSFDIN